MIYETIAYLFALVGFSLILAGCDLIPEDVQEKLSEELCRDNPDNELCDLENVKDLEDQAIIDFVNEAFTKAKEQANDTTCETVFSPTNPDLLDKCRDTDNPLIPADIDSFSALTVVKDGDYYVVTGETNNPGQQFVLTVRIVLSGGTSFIDDWQSVEINLTAGEVDIATATDFVDRFMMAYNDSSISGEEFCSMYMTPPVDNDCDLARAAYLAIDIRKEVQDVKNKAAVDNTFIITFTDGEEYEIDVFREDFGQVQAFQIRSRNDHEAQTTKAKDYAKQSFGSFVDDYLNKDLTDAEIAIRWMAPVSITENRTDDLLEDQINYSVNCRT